MRRLFFLALPLPLIAYACSATDTPDDDRDADDSGSGAASAGGGGAASSQASTGIGGFDVPMRDGGERDVMTNPCGTGCGDTELCDAAHVGLDDNCDGNVDEVCGCASGEAHSCFKGDPSYLRTPGCFAGTMSCTELGVWGPCEGGVHANAPDKCYEASPDACKPITSAPFANVSLKTGTGTFSADAVPGSESWSVICPPGVNPCPAVTAPDLYKPLQSGEYTVTYTKLVANDPVPKSCTYPLFVGAPGLRVELSWEHTLDDEGVDLDLHVHQPTNVGPWAIAPAAKQDCTWSNCTATYFMFQDPAAPSWFVDPPVMPPVPVNWYLDPVFENNTCYFAPHGAGDEWQQIGKGCHNPRLDLDNITCDMAVSDPDDIMFCAPENVNIDYPPTGEWIRIGVHYFSNHGLSYDVHPEIKVFCNGALAAQLGSKGFYDPETAITFTSADGAGIAGNRFWLVADVAFSSGDRCAESFCTVKPIYSDPSIKTPLFTLDTAATTTFAPPYPPPP